MTVIDTEAGKNNLTAMSVRAQVLVFGQVLCLMGIPIMPVWLIIGFVCFHKPWMIISGSLPLKHVKSYRLCHEQEGCMAC